MNVFKKLTALFKKAPPPAEYQQDERSCDDSSQTAGEIFRDVCHTAGLGDKVLDSVGAVEKFEEWYTGAPDEESVRGSLSEFKLLYPGVSAKLTSIGKL
jgi:hypothetical protein